MKNHILTQTSRQCVHWGQWIDQLVAEEVDTDHDGVVDTTLYPLTDMLGSVQLLTDDTGKVVERIEYDADGTPRFFGADTTVPTVTRVAWAGNGTRPNGDIVAAGVFEVGFSEIIDEAIAATVTLTPDGGSATDLTLTMDAGGRSAVLTGAALVAGTNYTLHVEGLKDRSGNDLLPVDIAFNVADTAVYSVLTDNVAPTVLAVMDSSDGMYLVLDEPVMDGTISVERNGNIVDGLTTRVSGQVVKWTPDAADWLITGEYTITSIDLTDLSDQNVEPVGVSFKHFSMGLDQVLVVYSQTTESSPLSESNYGVTSLFQGRGWHSDLGLYYYRARWYSPGLSSFLERDPLGYVDGLNLYQALGWNPLNAVDPSGESTILIVVGRGGSSGGMFLAAALTKKREAERRNPEDNVELYEWGSGFSSKDDLLGILARPRAGTERISEFHFFGHSFGGGLAIAYGDPSMSPHRNAFEYTHRSAQFGGPQPTAATIQSATETEQGIVLRHDFVMNSAWTAAKGQIRLNFENTAKAYLWGCMTTNVTDFEDFGYWRVFRGLKPARSLAKEMAVFLDRTVVGTNVGSEFQIRVNGTWILPQKPHAGSTSTNFKDTFGRYFGSRSSDFTAFDTRMVPSRGSYQEVSP